MSIKILKIAVTGTKGKTTVVSILAQVLRQYAYDRVLHVDTTGHFVNGIRKSTLNDSKRTWGLVPTVAPGRYLYEFFERGDDEQLAAVLEMSLGSSTLSGMGYAMHQVGVFLNVYSDHIGSSSRITSQADLLAAKKFVVTRILRDGYAVLNADDVLVCSLLPKVSKNRHVEPILFGLTPSEEVFVRHSNVTRYVTIKNGMVVYLHQGSSFDIVRVDEVSWTFNGSFLPSCYNLLAIVAAVIGTEQGTVPENLGLYIKQTKLDAHSGRLTQLEAKNGVRIIADYAHEQVSLAAVASLAHSMATPTGKVYGVVRLAYDRTDEHIKDVGHTIAPLFDYLVVYDKIDGYWKQPKANLQFDRFEQVVGKVSTTLISAIREGGGECEQILREDEAIRRVAVLAQPGDVVVVIVNDDIDRSIGFVTEAFDAHFV